MVAPEDKLPWFDAVCVVLPQLPWLKKECLRKGYRGRRNPVMGFCLTASEAIHHLSEDPTELWYVRFGFKPEDTHYFLKLVETGQRVDVTASQFPQPHLLTLYDDEQRRGFWSDQPSKRAQAVLDRIVPYREDVYFRRYKDSYRDEWLPRYGNVKEQKRRAENSNPSRDSDRLG